MKNNSTGPRDARSRFFPRPDWAPSLVPLFVAFLSLGVTSWAAEPVSKMELPAAQMQGGKPLMQALQARSTNREIRPDKLADQVMANLLWAAFGINRPDTAQRTAPSAMNSQEIDLFVALPQGVYLYEPKTQQLKLVHSEDVRARTGGQPFVTNAPITVLLIADLARLTKAKPEAREFYAAFDAGCISQNIYLFCASEGLATVVHELDRGPLTRLLKLGPEQKIILAQAIGLPAKGSEPRL
jgi:nitroreductase